MKRIIAVIIVFLLMGPACWAADQVTRVTSSSLVKSGSTILYGATVNIKGAAVGDQILFCNDTTYKNYTVTGNVLLSYTAPTANDTCYISTGGRGIWFPTGLYIHNLTTSGSFNVTTQCE